MEIQLEQLALFESDEMLFSSVKSEGRVCISKEREVFIRKLILTTRSRAILSTLELYQGENFFDHKCLLRT